MTCYIGRRWLLASAFTLFAAIPGAAQQAGASPADLQARVAELERRLAALEVLLVQLRAGGQQAPGAQYGLVRPGMTGPEVVALIGEPTSERAQTWTYPSARPGGSQFFVWFAWDRDKQARIVSSTSYSR